VKRFDQTQSRHAPAFTLIELLLSLLIIALLIGLLVVGMRHALAAARGAAGVQDVSSLKIAVQTFKNDRGFLPPLVNDGYDGVTTPLITPGRQTIPNVYNFGTDLEFLRGRIGEPSYRFSVYSLSYYIIGALDKKVDGIEGPGARAVNRDGSFNLLTNDTYDALFETKDDDVVFAPWQTGEDPLDGRFELRDRNGVAYRYYRWAGGTPQSTDNDLRFPNTPAVVNAAKDSVELGNAHFAIVAAGADGVFGDIAPDDYPPLETLSQIEDALGKRFEDDEEAERAARKDNIVEVGR
jgi:type II secretory pathway pseudopilin PulG